MSNQTSHPHPNWGKRLLAVFGWSAMAAIFGLTGWHFGAKPLAVPMGNWVMARDYQPVEATVIERTGKDDAGTFNWYAARYEISGKSYDTERLTVLEDGAIDEPSNAAVLKSLADARAQEKKVTVWVSPRKPDVALVSRDLPFGSLWSRAPFTIVFGVFALAGALGAVGALVGFSYYRNMVEATGLWVFGALWCGFIFPVLMLVTSQPSVEFFALIFVGFFALIGVLVVWGAIAASLTGQSNMTVSGFGNNSKKSNLSKQQLATSWGPKGKPVKGSVKRGGAGGRGGDFDKD
jgi:hypothetical protein